MCILSKTLGPPLISLYFGSKESDLLVFDFKWFWAIVAQALRRSFKRVSFQMLKFWFWSVPTCMEHVRRRVQQWVATVISKTLWRARHVLELHFSHWCLGSYQYWWNYECSKVEFDPSWYTGTVTCIWFHGTVMLLAFYLLIYFFFCKSAIILLVNSPPCSFDFNCSYPFLFCALPGFVVLLYI